jgi:hypothetical protein
MKNHLPLLVLAIVFCFGCGVPVVEKHHRIYEGRVKEVSMFFEGGGEVVLDSASIRDTFYLSQYQTSNVNPGDYLKITK